MRCIVPTVELTDLVCVTELYRHQLPTHMQTGDAQSEGLSSLVRYRAGVHSTRSRRSSSRLAQARISRTSRSVLYFSSEPFTNDYGKLMSYRNRCVTGNITVLHCRYFRVLEFKPIYDWQWFGYPLPPCVTERWTSFTAFNYYYHRLGDHQSMCLTQNILVNRRSLS